MTNPADVEKVARALCVADGENPDATHTKAAYDSGDALTDHNIPLWRQRHYYKLAQAAITAHEATLRERGMLGEWRPISEAPRDGTVCIVTPGGAGYTWTQGQFGESIRWDDGAGHLLSGWWTAGVWMDPQPTDYLPLPAAPSPRATGGDHG